MKFQYRELISLYAGLVLGLVVSLILAPKDEFFIPNFVFYWGSQLSIVALTLPLRPRPAIAGTLAAVLAITLAGFHFWVIEWSRSRDGGSWFIYLTFLVGAALGGLAAAWSSNRQGQITARRATVTTAVAVLGGSLLCATAACGSGVLYCR